MTSRPEHYFGFLHFCRRCGRSREQIVELDEPCYAGENIVALAERRAEVEMNKLVRLVWGTARGMWGNER